MYYKSLFDLWKKTCNKYENNIAFCDNTENGAITYKQAFRELCFLTEKMHELGLEKGDKVCLFAGNFPHWLILEQSVITNGGVCVSKNSEININELDYVLKNSDSCALITDKINVIEHFLNDNLKFIIYTGIDDVKFEAKKIFKLDDILSNLTDETVIKTDFEENPDDISYINYTSGTSANPKGAMLCNYGMAYVVNELQKFNDIKEGKTFVVTFPLASAGGKSFNLLCFSKGCRLVYTEYAKFWDVINKFQPEYLHCAPKIIQTMHSKFMTEVNNSGFIFKNMYNICYKFSLAILRFERNYIYRDKFLFMKKFINIINKITDKYFYKKIRNKILKDDLTLFIGSAHLAKPLEDYLQIMNIDHVQHYGLTETTGLDVSNTIETQKKYPYTVGFPFKDTIIKIVSPETNEELPQTSTGIIMLKGPEILKGYYKNEEASKSVLREDGFFNTRDLGYIDKDGSLVVLSRYDDVIVLSNGYNISTPSLENETKDSEYINQIVITGHGKPYLTALVVLNNDAYKDWCQKNNMKISNPNKNEKFKAYLIDHLNNKIKRKDNHRYYEKLKGLFFLKEEFTEENGMLTSTLKVKTRKITNTYQKEIDKLYEE